MQSQAATVAHVLDDEDARNVFDAWLALGEMTPEIQATHAVAMAEARARRSDSVVEYFRARFGGSGFV